MARLGKVSKAKNWVPHELTENNGQQRVNSCISLHFRQHQMPFLDRIVTGDEKWMLYNNVKCKKQWLDCSAKPIPQPCIGLHPKKILLCIWWVLKELFIMNFYETIKQ